MIRFAGSEKDPAGRWTISKFYGKKNLLKIYTVYRVCVGSKKLGETTAWIQQYNHFCKRHGKVVDTRKQALKDIARQIHKDILSGDEVILCGDLNESIKIKNGSHKV